MPDRIRAVMEEYIQTGSVPGLAWWVSRDGDVSRGELGTSRPDGAGDAVRADGLAHVVGNPQVEGLGRPVVVRRHEHHRRRLREPAYLPFSKPDRARRESFCSGSF